MKNSKCYLLIMTLGFSATLINAQIKVFSGGATAYGSTSAPAYGEKHHFSGDIIISSAPTLSSSAIFLRGNNGYSGATTPDYSWTSDNQTGFFHPTWGIMGISIAGKEIFRFNGNGQALNSNTTSSASTPDFSWNSDGNTGIFSAGSDIIGFSTGGVERMRLKSGGGLSIATPTDNTAITYSVTLNSDWYTPTSITYINRANSSNYEVQLNGTTKFYVSGGGWVYNVGGIYNASDRNLKDDIKGIDSAMSKVLQLNGVTYKLKSEKQSPDLFPNPQEYMGVIAQDVEKVAPQAVKIVHDGTKAVSYEMLVGLLIEALKEQNAKVAQLQSDVNNCCAKATPQNNRMISTPTSTINNNEGYNGGSFIKQNTPNPFNKETNIEYFIAEKNANSSILVFDMNGKLLKTLKLNSVGNGSIIINGNDFQPGMYYYSLIVNNTEIDTKKMILTE